jgi:lipopolysaccharide transport system permease protein
MRWLFNWTGHWEATKEMMSLITRHRQLTWEMAKREIRDRYAGQVFGLSWAVAQPLTIMGVYVFLFVTVFKVKIGGTVELPLDYPVYILSGLIPWYYFQESLAKGCVAITSNASLVKQVVFPIEVLPVKGVIAAMISQLIATIILFGYILATFHSLPWTVIFFPAAVFFEILLMVGVSYILSSVGVYFRDIKDIVQVFLLVAMYIMPIFYLPAMAPKMFQPVLYLNPFSYMIWVYQDIFFFGRFEHTSAWVIFPAFSIAAFYGGYRVFRKLRIMFGNVL